MTSRNHSFRRK